jgi:hypothetical protein
LSWLARLSADTPITSALQAANASRKALKSCASRVHPLVSSLGYK